MEGNLIWDHDVLQKPETFEAKEFDRGYIKALFYKGLPYMGKETRVFAYVGIPEMDNESQIPGIVLVHGGGGTAFSEWVEIWNKRGYAAIAIDLEGHIPVQFKGESPGDQFWEGHLWSGPARKGTFEDVTMSIKDQWMYHTVADVMLAYSLLAAFPGVDEGRIGITGISWGGIITSLVTALDSRFCFAIPVYGCGYLYESYGAFGTEFSNTDKKCWDPSNFLQRAKMPFLWVNSDHDEFFSINCTSKSHQLVKPNSLLSIHPDLKHSHEDGWSPPEIYAFADGITGKGRPLTKIINQGFVGENEGRIFVEYEAEMPVKKAILIFSKTGLEYGSQNWAFLKEWISKDITVDGQNNTIEVQLPKDARFCYINLIDECSLIVSSDLYELE